MATCAQRSARVKRRPCDPTDLSTHVADRPVRHDQSVVASTTDLATVIGGVGAALVIAGAARELLRRTVARRRLRYRALRRLGTGAQLDFFTSTLGEPPTIKRRREISMKNYSDEPPSVEDVEFTECFFVESDHVVQALVDAEGTVLAFSVSATSRRFRPTLHAPRTWPIRRRLFLRLRHRWRPLIAVTLHRTKFDRAVPSERDNAPDERYARVRAWMGARAWSYSEAHSFGNPGFYGDYILTSSSAAPARRIDYEALMAVSTGFDESFDDGTHSVSPLGRRFRRRSVVTTWTVLSFPMTLDDYSVGFGPHEDEIRTLR